MAHTHLQQEFIGKKIRVLAAPQNTWVNKEYVIVDETKNTFTLLVDSQFKTMLKKGLTFEVNGSGVVIYGKDVLKRPEDRIKGM